MRFEITERCVGCLACVRVCPSQAIAVDGSSVRIVDESCIRAGACVPACPHDAIDAVGDLEAALEWAESDEAVLLLSVEAEVYFHPFTPEQVVNAGYAAGFPVVHRGVVGDELIAEEYRRVLGDPGWKTMVRSTCPIVVERIRHDFPELVPYLAPIATPVAAEVAYIRERHGAKVPIVYAGVCLSDGAVVDAAVTFAELAELFRRRGVDIGEQPRHFSRIPEVRQRHMSTAGGLPLPVLSGEPQTSRRFRKVRGMGSLDVLARAVAIDGVELGFVDLLPCEGCLDHPLMGPRDELYRRRRLASEAEPPRSALPVLDPAVEVGVGARFEVHLNGRRPADDEVVGVIDRIGRATSGAPWDCGACGYGTCEQFAVAYLNGRAAFRQCPPYQERRADDAQREAAVDGLTGLATYRVMQERLQEEVARSQRTGQAFGLLFFDVDRFKEVNDTFGHEAGNEVLELIGGELRKITRKTDVAARYGGDEFVVVLVATGPEGTRRVGEVVRQAVERVGLELGFGALAVTASIGGSAYDPETGKPEDPLAAADQALYAAKSAGGNRVVVHED